LLLGIRGIGGVHEAGALKSALSDIRDSLLPVCGLPTQSVGSKGEGPGMLTMHNTLITLFIIAHPGEHRFCRLAFWSNNDQTHLSINRYQRLVHQYIAAAHQVDQHAVLLHPDLLWESPFHPRDVLFLHSPLSEFLGQFARCLPCQAHNHQSRGQPIQSVDSITFHSIVRLHDF